MELVCCVYHYYYYYYYYFVLVLLNPQSPQLSQRDDFVCSDILREPTCRAFFEQPSIVLQQIGDARQVDQVGHGTIELDLRPHNLGLITAWMRAQDRSKWRQLVGTAVLTDGHATR